MHNAFEGPPLTLPRALMGIVPPSGLDGYEAGEKIGEKIKIFES